MNFIELQSTINSPILVNLSTVSTIIPHRQGAMIYFDGEDSVAVENAYDDIRSTIETMQKRNGK